MGATHFEYFTLLAFLLTLAVSLYGRELVNLSRSLAFWFGLVAFVLLSTIVESIALYSDWWRFNSDKITGICLGSIPIEEYCMFVGFYTMVAAQWNGHEHELE